MEEVQSFLVPLYYPNSDSNPITNIQNGSLKNTVVSQHFDGTFSVLKIKESGAISKFPLDVQIKRCLFHSEYFSY